MKGQICVDCISNVYGLHLWQFDVRIGINSGS